MTTREILDKGEISEMKKCNQLIVIYKDIFDMKAMYELMHEWLLEEGFTDYNGAGKDAFETFYWERRKPGTIAKDFNIWWRVKKQVNAWWSYYLNIEFVGIHVDKKEIMYEGKKLNMDNGEIDVFITPIYFLDESKLWSGGTIFDPFLRPFRLNNLKKDWSWHKKQIENVAERLQMAIKDFLDLRQFVKRGQPLHGKKGLDWD
jgi:hypothetical protein